MTDDRPVEVWKTFKDGEVWLSVLFNNILRSEMPMPDIWGMSTLVPIFYKNKGDVRDLREFSCNKAQYENLTKSHMRTTIEPHHNN